MSLSDSLNDNKNNKKTISAYECNELDISQELYLLKIKNEKRLNNQMTSSLMKLDIISFAETYMNKNELVYERAKMIKPEDGFEDFLIHGEPNAVIYETTNGTITKYSASEFADSLRCDPRYKGGNIRLLACNSGFDSEGFAQQLADILNVEILAPTETLWVDEKGELFITNNETLAEMWENDKSITQTGEWKLFHSRKEHL